MELCTKDDFKRIAESLCATSTIKEDDLRSLIPTGINDSWEQDWSNIQFGFKYRFTLDDGTTVLLKWHSADPDAAIKWPDGNSGKGWTAQIRVGCRLLCCEPGKPFSWLRRADKWTHIPLIRSTRV